MMGSKAELSLDLVKSPSDHTLDRIIQVIDDSFQHDPSFQWFANAQDRAKVASAVVFTHLRSGFDVWVARRGGDIVAAILVEQKQSRWRSVLGLMRCAKLWLALPRATVKRMNDYAIARRKNVPKNARLIAMIGVGPPHAQGQGIGSTFLRRVEARYAADRPWALDTENPNNLAIYEKLGYQKSGVQSCGPCTIYQFHKPDEKRS